MSAWFREVCSVKVGDIVKDKREMFAVEAHTPVGEVLDILREENLISVGVYGAPGSWLGSGGVTLVSSQKQYIGVVSIVDLLSFILSGGDAEERITSRVVLAIGSTQESMSLWVESYDRPLYFAMEQFCKGTFYFYDRHHFLADASSQLSPQVHTAHWPTTTKCKILRSNTSPRQTSSTTSSST